MARLLGVTRQRCYTWHKQPEIGLGLRALCRALIDQVVRAAVPSVPPMRFAGPADSMGNSPIKVWRSIARRSLPRRESSA